MSQAPLLVGQTVGPYEIHALIAEGGVAQVYRATHRFLNRETALKVLFPAHAADAEFVERLRREGEHTARLQHPHIVPVFDAGVVEARFYLAMAYIEGQSLAQRLRRGALPLDEAATILTQIAAALDYAHAQGVTHRDVKPSNILLDQAGRAYLADFGIAKAWVDPALTQTGALIGTPAYMAPELIAGRPFDGRADIYALGLVLYEMVTGRPAFQGGLETLLYQQVHQKPLPPQRLNPHLPAKAARVIQCALEKDPARRFASAGALAQAFQEAITVPTSNSRGISPRAAPAPVAASRFPFLPGALIAVGIVLLSLFGLLVSSALRNLQAQMPSAPPPTSTAPAAWHTALPESPTFEPALEADTPTAPLVANTPASETLPAATSETPPTSTPRAPTSTPAPAASGLQYCILPSANPRAPNAPARNINPRTCQGEGGDIPVNADIAVLQNEVTWQADCGLPVIRATYQGTGYLIFVYRIGIRDAGGACTPFDGQTHFSRPRTE